MSSSIVLIDIDSTLNNFQERFLSIFRERYPDLASQLPNNPSHYDALRLDKKKSFDIFMEDGFNEGMVPLEGAVNAVHEIEKRGFRVFFCTALVTDTSNALKDKVQWIGRYFGPEFMNRVIFTKDKTLARGQFLIDDSPFKTKGILQPEWKLIVFDMIYNKQDECYGRIFGWTDLVHLFSLLGTP